MLRKLEEAIDNYKRHLTERDSKLEIIEAEASHKVKYLLEELDRIKKHDEDKDLNQSQNLEEYEEGGDTIGIANNSTVETSTAHSSGFIRPPEPPRKRFRKNVETGQSDNGEISQAIKKLDEIANNAAVDKPYDLFGKYVARELLQLTKQAAILLQQDIQNCITRAKLDISSCS
ncbi:hypothetical protein JTB14_015924 [Gonioctena quinquepunctata]|nr:hypothetical protein JTB14_015924 [Gonioctena quinquepunctata]